MPRKKQAPSRGVPPTHKASGGAGIKPHAVPGRKPRLDEAMMKEIEECLMLGNSHKTAYTLAGMSRSSFYEWIERGEAAHIKQLNEEKLTENESWYAEFSDRVKKALEKGKKRHIQIINAVAQGGQEAEVTKYYDRDGNVNREVTKLTQPNWLPSAWVLERRYPDEFGKKEKLDVNSNVNQTVTIDTKQVEELIKSLPEEDILRIVRDAKRDKESGEHSDTPGLAH